ncbi:MAG: hypothetical protein N3A64_03250 [Desulfobacterota bacterium]|nr:hypothetical protein [Thermodesulfobacteriota bacterium]
MAKINHKKNLRINQESGLSHTHKKKELENMLEEIIREYFNPDCNLILLENKIKELEKFPENYPPLLMKKFRQSNSEKQKVVYDLLVRRKNKTIIRYLEDIIKGDFAVIKIMRQALLQLQKWEEKIDENLLGVIEKGEEVIYAIEKFLNNGGYLEKSIFSSITPKFNSLPPNIKRAITKQVIEDYPSALPLILKIIQEQTEFDEKMVALLATKSPTLELAELLSNWIRKTEDKNIRRRIKRYLFQMKNRGINISVPSTDEDIESVKFSFSNTLDANVYITGIDYIGDRLVFISKSVLRWGTILFQITLSDQEGIKNFNAFNLSRKEIKNFLKNILKNITIQLVEITPDYGYFLIDEAYHINLNKGIPLPEQFIHFKTEIDELKGSITEPLIYSCFPQDFFDENNLNAFRQNYHSIFNYKEFKGWFLEPRLIVDYLEKINEAENSPLILSNYQIEERYQTIFTEAVRKIFNQEWRRIYQRRLEEMAYILFCLQKKEISKLALAAGYDLRKEGIISENHSFIRELVKRSFSFYKKTNENSSEDSLIISR